MCKHSVFCVQVAPAAAAGAGAAAAAARVFPNAELELVLDMQGLHCRLWLSKALRKIGLKKQDCVKYLQHLRCGCHIIPATSHGVLLQEL